MRAEWRFEAGGIRSQTQARGRMSFFLKMMAVEERLVYKKQRGFIRSHPRDRMGAGE
jgi:hypothetical protein